MSDSDASLPLPSPADSGGGDIDDKGKSASRNLGHGTDDSNSDSGSSPGKIPTPSTPKNGRDSIPHSLTLLEDIPYPTDVDTSQVPNQDHDDIPLPPDSSRYSPSQVTPGDDENESMMSPSESTESASLDKKPSTVTMKVLGSAQAKKRLLAFSASKQAAVSYSPLNKKVSPLKGVSVFHQAANKKEITKEQTLAIASIKEEETKMKEILAMNSILNEKLKQVKSITENIPKAPPITAVVNPTVVTENFRITDINSKLSEEEMFSKKSLSSANSRNLRKKRASSSSRSRSRSHSLSKSPSVDSRSRKRDKHSRSRSRDRGRERDKDRRDRDRLDRDRIREKEKKSSSRKSRSRSRSPKIKKEKKRSKSRSRSPKHKKDKDKSRKRSKSRSHSRDRVGRKRSPKSENKKDYESRDRDRERSRQKEKERELEREKEKERERKESEKKREEEKKREREEAAEKELDKIRKVRMPFDWPDYDLHQYRPTDIHKLWGAMVIKSSRSKSPTQSDAKGSNPSKEVPQPTPLSKTLSKQLKSMNVVPLEAVNGGSKDYPSAFVKNTKCKPPITYGCNILTYSGYYKSRQQVFKDEEAEVMHAMSEIISQKGSTVKQFPSSSDVWKSKKKQQEWFAPTDQVFCPSEGSKGIVISHLYSDDEGDDSPAGSLKGRKPANTNDRTIEITPIPVLQQKSPSSPDSMDSAPSPLLKKKYNSDEPSGKDNADVGKEVSHVAEQRGKRDSSYEKSSSDEDKLSRKREIKKSEKLATNFLVGDEKEKDKTRKSESDVKSKTSYNVDDKPTSHSRRNETKDVSPKIQDEEDDDMYEEMELEEFPLEKEIAANLKTSDKEKKDKEKHKGKESKDKSKKAKKQKRKKKHHKSKDKHEKKKSSDDEEEDFEGHDSSDADSARLKTSKKSSKKEKTDKPGKEKRHRKRRSKTESSKGSDSSSDSENSDDSSKKRPKKKKSKLSSTNDDVVVEKSVDTKKSKSAAHETVVTQPVVEKERSRKEKKKRHEKSKSKKKHSKKNRSSSSSSTESSDSESSSSSESSSDTSEEGSDEDRKVKKADKKKKSKKDKKESKKARDKTPDSSDNENHKRGGGRRDDRGGGGGLGGSSGRSGGGHYPKDFRDRDREQSYRDRDRDRGGDKRNNYGRRRNGEFGELFDSLGDWDSVSPLQMKDNEKCAGRSPISTESFKEQPGKLSHASKQTHELLTAIDNDLLLQSVLMNEDLSAETLLKQITEPVESDRSTVTVGSKAVYNLSAASAPSNWSDDSEEENATAAAAEKTDVKIPPSSGYGTERSTETLKDTESGKNSDGSDSSSEDSSDSESSSSSSDSQSDSDSNNAKEKTDLSEVKDSEIKSNENKVPSQVPVLYDPFADNSDATSGSSDSEKKESVEVKKEKINHNIINPVDVYKEDNKFYEDLKNTMEVLNKYENKVDVSSCNDTIKTIKELEHKPLKVHTTDGFPEASTKTIVEKGVEISPTKLLNFKISGSKLDRNSLTAFGTEENTVDVKSIESHGTKPVSPQKKEKAIPVITSKDPVEQFPISVLGSTCNKITPIPNVTMFTEEHINLGVDNYRCDVRESHERSRYIKPVPTLRSRSRSYSRSPSRSRSRSFSPHRRVPSGAPPPVRFHRSGSYERERAAGRSHRRRSPPPEMFFHGRRPHGGDRRRHFHHQGHPGEMMPRRRERERFRRPMSRSKSRSRSRSRSISRSRSRSISPRSHGSGYHHRSRRMEMFDRDRRGRGHYFEPRDHRERRYVRERDYHDRERSRTPEHLSPTELRLRKKHGDFVEDRMPHEDRVPLKDRDNKLATDSEGELVPVAQKQESPPLQLNVADSTISDSELASRNAIGQLNTGNVYIGGISREMLIDHHNSGHMELPHPLDTQLHSGHLPPESIDNDLCGDYNSPPRRLSLDERLEMEMGISLRDEPVNKIQQTPGCYYYPPSAYRMPGHEHPDQGKYLPVLPHSQPGVSEHGHYPGAIPSTWNAAGKGFANGKPQRAQSQIVQVGNVIQVVPADIPVVPITITSSSKSRRSSSSERKKQSVPKRVITIKVPVVPFSVPIMQPEDLANMQPPLLTEEENLVRLRRKNRKLKRKRRLAAELAKKRSSTIGEEEDATTADNKEEENQEASPKENIQLKSDENQQEIENLQPSVENETKTNDDSKLEDNPEDQCLVSATATATDKDVNEANAPEENKDVPEKPLPRKIEILPPPDKGILVAAGFREKTLDENNKKIIKGVKFADGINPGCGTSSSEGEEMTSPPPPSEMNSVSSKKSKMLRKKKIKVKIVRKVEEKKPEESKTEPESEPEIQRPPPPPSPPPCPSAAYPFCPPGILYQVCSQYAVLYAQAMAEKGIDIVFQPSTQIPMMGENLILSDTVGEHSLEAPENIDFQASESALATVHEPSYEHSSSNIQCSTESPVQTTGSRIPTIIRTSSSPPMLDYGIDKSDCSLMISPLSSEIVDNSIPTISNISRKRSISKNIVEVPIVDMDCVPKSLLQPETLSQTDLNLDEIPLPIVHLDEIPVPVGTPPLSFHISSKPKKYIGKLHNKHIMASKLRNKSRSALTTSKFVHSTPSSNIVVTPISDQMYDYNAYPHSSDSQSHSQSTGLSPGPAQVSISVSAPPPHIPTIPPGVDLSRPPPSFTPPPPGTIDFSTPSPNSSVASALGNGSVSNNSSPNNVSSITSISIVVEEQNLSSRILQKEQDNDIASPTPPPPGTSPRYVCS